MAINLTDRDVVALTELGELGLMSTEMIFTRHYDTGGSSGPKYLQKRLRQLRDENLIETTKFADSPLPNVHRLSTVGADAIEARTSQRPRRPAHSKPLKAPTLLHRLGVVATRLAIDDAYQASDLAKPRWILEQDTVANVDAKAKHHERFILSEFFGRIEGQNLGCRPDASALLQLPGSPPWNLIVYLEYDRATEEKDQIRSKIPGYATLLHPSNRHYLRHWPDVDREFARVLFICPTPNRIEKVSQWVADLPGSEYLRLATPNDLDPQTLLTNPIWRTVYGDTKAMIATH